LRTDFGAGWLPVLRLRPIISSLDRLFARYSVPTLRVTEAYVAAPASKWLVLYQANDYNGCGPLRSRG
jgi:hypothetical protein